MQARRSLCLLVIVSLASLATLASCSRGPSLDAPPAPAGGQVAGRLVSQTSDGSHRTGQAGQPVGAFTTAVRVGPVLQNPPQPVATAVTTSDGIFSIRGLDPGRYFITVAQPGPAVTGAWVRVTADQGESVLLVICTDCPVPLAGSDTT
jgi:hypothetical protein